MRLGRIFVPLVLIVALGCVGRDVPDQVTTDTLLAVTPGMTYAELESTIAPPLCYRKAGFVKISEKASRQHPELCFRSGPTSLPAELRDDDVTLSYHHDTWHLVYPRIYISMSGGKVQSVYIKEATAYDDMGIYSRNEMFPNGKFYAGGSRERLRELIGR